MKKILMTAVIAMIAVHAHAQSSVTLFGAAQGGLRWTDGTKGGRVLGPDNGTLTGSSFGLAGTEDLGQNTKVLFRLESGFDSSTGKLGSSQEFFSQGAYVGMSGAFGRVLFGRQLTAGEEVGIVFDPNYAQGTFATAPLGLWGDNYFRGVDSRFDNTIKYQLATGGLTAGASYSPGGVAGSLRAGSDVSIGATWQYRTVMLGAVYQQTYDSTSSRWARTALGAVAWQIGPSRLYFSYADFAVKAEAAGAPQRHDNIPAVGVVYNATPYLQFSGAVYYDLAHNLSNVPGADGNKVTAYAVAQYSLSKRTRLYVEFDRNSFSGAYKSDPLNVIALSLRPDGRTVTSVSMGIVTQF